MRKTPCINAGRPSGGAYRRALSLLTILVILGITLTLSGCLESTANNPRATPFFDSNNGGDDDDDTIDDDDDDDDDDETPVTGLLHISAGANYNCAIKKADNSLSCWGANEFSQIGDSDQRPKATPRLVSSTGGWETVDAGTEHTCAIRDDDQTLWCWGHDEHDELGPAADTNGPEFVQIVPFQIDAESPTPLRWLHASLGTDHTCAINTDQQLLCWGSDEFGQLGHNPADPADPSEVKAGTQWLTMASGAFHACAIDLDNDLWCWGANESAQLGDNSETARDIPTLIGAGAQWIAIDTHASHSCGIQADDTLWCWGNNEYGQLGTNSVNTERTPVLVDSGPWLTVATGGRHSCALKDDFSLWCWGKNDYGQLGDGSTAHQAKPTPVATDEKFTAVLAGDDHTCALTDSDRGYCWGSNLLAQLGNGVDNTVTSFFPLNTFLWKSISGGDDHTCAIRSDDTLWCGGINESGQLGDGTPLNRGAPVIVRLPQTVSNAWQQVDSGGRHTCAINSDNTLWCWGSNLDLQLGRGQGDLPLEWLPTQIDDSQWVQVSAGSRHTCAIKDDAVGNTLWCWGANDKAQLGRGSASAASSQIIQVGNDADWVYIAAGDAHSCGIRRLNVAPVEQVMYCWGDNTYSQVSWAVAEDVVTALTQVGNATDWVAVVSGNGHNCGLRLDPATLSQVPYCWGSENDGLPLLGQEVGNAEETVPEDFEPLKVNTSLDTSLTPWTMLTAGPFQTCAAVNATGQTFCWGDNRFSQTIPSTVPTFDSPQQILQPGLTTVASGAKHSCGLLGDDTGQLICWGNAASYQLGNDNAWKVEPEKVPLE